MTDSFPTMARYMPATLCEVLQNGTVIAETVTAWSAKDIANAMQVKYPHVTFTWRWKE